MNDPSLKLRRARIEDVPFLAQIDLAVDVEDADNPHVVALNVKLGYRVIRAGPLWDEIVRVSLIKHL